MLLPRRYGGTIEVTPVPGSDQGSIRNPYHREAVSATSSAAKAAIPTQIPVQRVLVYAGRDSGGMLQTWTGVARTRNRQRVASTGCVVAGSHHTGGEAGPID